MTKNVSEEKITDIDFVDYECPYNGYYLITKVHADEGDYNKIKVIKLYKALS